MSDKVPIAAQAMAVELAYLSARDHRAGIRTLVENGKRPQHELDLLNRRVPELAAAAQTLKWLALNEEDIKAALARGGA